MYVQLRIFYFFLCILLLIPYHPVVAFAEGEKQAVGKSDSIGEKKVYRIAGEKHLAPFSYINKNGEFTGFSIDIFDAIAEKENVEFEYIPMELYQATRALQEGEINAIMGLKYSAEQNRIFQFSEPYFTMTDVVIIPNHLKSSVTSLTDLRGKTVALREDPASFELLMNVRRIEFQVALNPEDALHLLFLGRADAYLSNKWTAEFYLEQSQNKGQYTVLDELGVPSEFVVATQPEDTELLAMINDSFASMQASGEYQSLYTKWFAPSSEERLREMRNWIIVLLVAVGLTFASLVVIYSWNKRLKKEVEKRTFALADANRELAAQQRETSRVHAFKTQIINHMYYGILTFDDHLHLTSLNERAKEMLCLTEVQSIQTADIQHHPLMRQIFQTYETAKKKKSGPFRFMEEIEYKQDGESRFVISRVIPLHEDQDQTNGYLMTLADRSEERMLEKKLATQEKMRALGQLVAGVAHEVRNPLTSVKAFIDLLPRKYEDPAFRKEMLKHVPEELKRMNRIVESLLDYARPKYPQKASFDVESFIHSLVTIIEPTLKKQGVSLCLEIEPSMQLYSDPNQIKQVMLNLILNALDAMEVSAQKKLLIQAETENGTGFIRVTDTGSGIEEEELPHILEPFYTTKKQGVGLGLALCYQWIQENNGEINIETKIGDGTTFILTLPITKEKEGHEHESSCTNC
ncbi:transporter substrate-binding domain-containing protein [Metabacillus rhizolycopersici]|uniref:histidine kinase n=1 Tax=Metabacillus rhizolycopersici TaxID=2875709 RepID=A0ABS7UN56_9BACI|nr:transporter substrate-binding domain-containing protein [Metabacillus rhizolycopersici]MBZ5749477.1 transporter substrate-binding domain-containing protein [Metabacillus rhizolycopersici]